ncbi:hypothetical protein ACQR2B_17505 [Bradyrhizobium oligotrophicum]|uniref:hypothetical protein n=1 Tax=Bradyrhizobium TaxID=374 RepID=UPI003EB7F71B
MASRFESAALLAALWRLGSGGKKMPTSHGILDRALNECVPVLPAALTTSLSFGNTSVGLRCYELPDILLAAQEALITSEPNPTYLSTDVTLGDGEARQIVLSHGISTADAKAIGQKLVAAAAEIETQFAIDPDRPAAA